MLVSRIVYPARRGFGMDIDQVRKAMGDIAKKPTHQPKYSNILGPNFGIKPSKVKSGQPAVYLSKKEAVDAMQEKKMR